MRYVALLRGINVGGNNRVDMKDLKAVFESAGVSSVRTYINSGNVIFSAPIDDRAALTDNLGRAIAKHFGFDVALLLRDIDQMRAVVSAIPAHWSNDDAMRCDVLFLWAEVDRPSVVEVLDFRPEIEDVLYAPGAVIWRVDRENVTKSRMSKIIGTPIYKQMTARNCNTVRKLLKLMED